MKTKIMKIIVTLIVLAITPLFYLSYKYVKSPSEAYYTQDCFNPVSVVPHEDFEIYLWMINESSSEIYSLVDYFEDNSNLLCLHDSSYGEDLRRCSTDYMDSATIIGPLKSIEIRIIPSTITINNTGLVRSIEGPREKTFIKSNIKGNQYWIGIHDLRAILKKDDKQDELVDMLTSFQSSCDNFITEKRSSWKAS